MELETLAVRVDARNPNHHLYRNNGTWWVHYTVHTPNYTKKRVRRSLATKNLAAARQCRDDLFKRLSSLEGVALAA